MRRLATQLVRHLSPPSTRADGDLLAGFLAGADDDFAELVRRHGACVWGVCRRALPNPADAEDAFQAVFLVLVRKARGLTGAATVGPWLHRVAVWTSRGMRRRNARRGEKSAPLPEQVPAPAPDPDLPLDLDAALLALPEKYRSPIVLCHLLGLSRAEAAGRLGCAEGTLSAWLSRGLAKLRTRLGGLDPARALGLAAVAVPAGLSGAAVRAAAVSRAAVAASASTASLIAEGVIRMFWVKKATAASAALLAVFALGVGVGVSTRYAAPDAAGQEKVPATEPDDRKRAEAALLRELEAVLAAKQASADALKAEAAVLAQRARSLAADKADPRQIERAEVDYQRALAAQQQAVKELAEMKKRLEDLKAKARPAGVKPPVPDAVAELDAQLGRLKQELEAIKAQSQEFAARAAEAEARARDLAAKAELLAIKRAELMAKAPAGGRTFVEVTLRGEAGKFDFVLRETDAKGREIGTAVVREPEMLAKLLSHVKNDPNAPKELRLVAEPPTAAGMGPAFLFKAADAAGYKTVRFTGYVIAGGYTPALKPGQKGGAVGYRWYDGSEKSPAELLKEHDEGMRRD